MSHDEDANGTGLLASVEGSALLRESEEFQPDHATPQLTTKAKASVPTKKSVPTKADLILKKLSAARGVTVETMMEVTGWQAHSVRGFLSGTVKKKLGHAVVSDVGKDGVRRYLFEGKSYRSLTAIAHKITEAHWSGPRFFGL